MEAVITVARIQQPAPGKKTGAIYDENDQRWGVFPDDLSAFAVGGVYKIWDWNTNMFQGRQYKTIKSGNYMYQGMGNVVPQAPRSNAAPAPQRSYQPRASGGPVYGADDAVRRRDIFVCGALNNILSNGGVPMGKDGMPDGQALVTLVWRLRKVFDYTLGPQASDPSISTARVGREATPQEQAEAAMGYGRVDGEPIPPQGRNDMNDEIPF